MKLILIDAQSEVYSVKEIVAEDKAVKRLQRIRDCFTKMQRLDQHARLKVTTTVVNPEFNFS